MRLRSRIVLLYLWFLQLVFIYMLYKYKGELILYSSKLGLLLIPHKISIYVISPSKREILS
jgi:hypothetical protein